MWRYLKSAFLVGIDVPTLGRLPVNVLAVAGVAILGFVEPSAWLLGTGLEAAFLFALAFNPRFQKIVDGRQLQASGSRAADQRQELIRSLSPATGKRYSNLASQCERTISLYRASDAEDFILESNRHALDNLQWLYLKLLVAQQNLATRSGDEDEESLQKRIVALEAELKDMPESGTLAKSKSATLAILRQRVNVLHNREQTLKEIESDLTRIEEQISLLTENASLQGKPQAISSEIELATDLVSGSIFGGAESAVAEVDRAYLRPQTASQKAQQQTS